MKNLIFIFIILVMLGCTSSHGNWMTSTYGVTPNTKQHYGYIKSAHELYPVLNVGDNIYVKFDLPNIQKIDSSNSSCHKNYNTITFWVWSEKNLFLNKQRTVFVINNKEIKVDKIEEWDNGKFISSNTSKVNKIAGNNSVGEQLVKLWESNEISSLLKSDGLNVFKFHLSSPISCGDDFELKFAYQVSPASIEPVVKNIYFTPAEYQKFNK